MTVRGGRVEVRTRKSWGTHRQRIILRLLPRQARKYMSVSTARAARRSKRRLPWRQEVPPESSMLVPHEYLATSRRHGAIAEPEEPHLPPGDIVSMGTSGGRWWMAS